MRNVMVIVSFAIYPALAVLAGGTLALFRAPGPAARSTIQHFAAGVIFAALATELLPDLVHRRLPWVTLAGFSLGVMVMLGLKKLTEGQGQTGGARTSTPVNLVVVLGIDVLLDGLLIGLGFAAGQKQGLLLTVALSLEVLFLGLSCSTALVGTNTGRRGIVGVLLTLASLLVLGTLIGATLLAMGSPALVDAVLAFGAAALLYLVTEELLVEAHESPETPFQAAMFFAGFIVLLTIEMLL